MDSYRISGLDGKYPVLVSGDQEPCSFFLTDLYYKQTTKPVGVHVVQLHLLGKRAPGEDPVKWPYAVLGRPDQISASGFFSDLCSEFRDVHKEMQRRAD